MSMPDDWKLLVIERIFACRCAAAPPARAHNALSRVCGMAPQMLQPRRQGRGRHGERVHHEEEMCANVEYLVLGHFKRKEGDTATPKARTPCCGWRSLISTTRPCQRDAKLDAWEEQSARFRKEARRLQREVAAET